jgi:hypothetical protein
MRTISIVPVGLAVLALGFGTAVGGELPWAGGIIPSAAGPGPRVLSRTPAAPRLAGEGWFGRRAERPGGRSGGPAVDERVLAEAFARLERKVRANRAIPDWARDNVAVLMKARLLAGLAAEVRWSQPMAEKAGRAVRICRAVGGITHNPPRPPGMDDQEYRHCRQAAAESCLAFGRPTAAVRMYLEDFGAHNAREVGHRRTLLRPDLAATGIDRDGIISALAVDLRVVRAMPAAIAWPAPGAFPAALATRSMPWSIDLIGRGLAAGGRPLVKVTKCDSGGEGASGRTLAVRVNNSASDLLVFVPRDLDPRPGNRYAVEVRGLQVIGAVQLPPGMWLDEAGTLHYRVEFSGLGV